MVKRCNNLTQANSVLTRVCVTAPDMCASSPCVNGATCVNQYNKYTCTCAPGYKGVTCSSGRCMIAS
jgi:hypothetical protein